MTDLDIETAQLIIQLARDDLYQLDDDDRDNALSDLEFALAEQEREFMQYWMDYGDAQMNGRPRNPGPPGGDAATIGHPAIAGLRPNGIHSPPRPVYAGLEEEENQVYHNPYFQIQNESISDDEDDDDDDDDDDGVRFYPNHGLTPGASTSTAGGPQGQAASPDPEPGTSTARNVTTAPSVLFEEFDGFDNNDIHSIQFLTPIQYQAAGGSPSGSAAPVNIPPLQDAFDEALPLPNPAPSSPPVLQIVHLPVEESDAEDDASEVSELSYQALYIVERSVECHFCKETRPISITMNTSCEHHLCQACVSRMIDICVKDETMYPPKCCGNKLQANELKIVLDLALQGRYEAKVTEYETPVSTRVYCYRCGDFLDSKSSLLMTGTSTSTGTVVHTTRYCSNCSVRTCVSCKKASHPANECQDTPDELALKSLAKQKGWQTCPVCKTVVELKEGCYHMTCRCTAQFCYLCAVKWKECNCPAFEEDRLLRVAA